MLSYSWLYSVWGHFSIEQSGQTHAQYFVHEHFCLCICQQFASSFSCKTLVTGCYALPPFMSWTTISRYSSACSIPVGARSCSFREFDHTTTPALRTKEWASSSFASSSLTWSAPYTHALCSLLAWHWHSMCHHIFIDYCVYKLNVLCLEWRSWLSWLSPPHV